MPDHDVIVIGAGHNGLTAASLLARAGVDVLCIEKNRYVGGMASTVELFDGYHFEIAGSVVFPIAPYVVADLDLENCGLVPIPREIMATNIGDPASPRCTCTRIPFRMLQHLAQDHGADAAEGFAQLAAFVQGPAARARPLQSVQPAAEPRPDLRRREDRRGAQRAPALLLRQRDGHRRPFLPDPSRHKILRTMLAFLAVNSTFRGPYTPGSATCLVFALAAPENGWVMHKLKGGIGALTKGLARKVEERGGQIRFHRAGRADPRRERPRDRRRGSPAATASPRRRSCSNLDPTSTFRRLIDERARSRPTTSRA